MSVLVSIVLWLVLSLPAQAAPAFSILQAANDTRPDVSCNFVTGVPSGIGASGSCLGGVLPTCDGVTNTETSWLAFQTWAVSTWQASHTGLIELYIPPGTNCLLNSSNIILDGIRKIRISGQGATLSGAYSHLGGPAQYQDNLHSVRLQTVAAGSNTVAINLASPSFPAGGTIPPCSTLATCSALFTVGGWALVAGIDAQPNGFPSNPVFHQYVHITDINSTTGAITFASPLLETYKSTWPNWQPGSNNGAGGGGCCVPDDGGPATLYAFQPGWDIEVEWRGITIGSTIPTTGAGKSVIYRDLAFTGSGQNCPYATMSRTTQFINVSMPLCSMEVDKMNDTLSFDNVVIDQVLFQSIGGAPFFNANRMTIRNLIGTGYVNNISNSTITSQLLMGPLLYGFTKSITVSNSVVASVGADPNPGVDPAPHTQVSFLFQGPANNGGGINQSGNSMTAGVITIPNTDITGGAGYYGWMVPGINLCWSYLNSTGISVSCNKFFQVTDVTQDATNTYVHTTEAGGFPTDISGACTPPAPSDVSGCIRIQVHPALQVTFNNVTGSQGALALSRPAAQGLPIGSYNYYTYDNASTGTAIYWPMYGNLQKLNITVNTAYTGVLASTVKPNTLFHQWYDGSWAPLTYVPAIVNLKTGQGVTRALDATGGYPALWNGTAGGDTLTTLPAARWANSSWRDLFDDISSDPSHPMSVTVEVLTTQGVVIP